MAVPSSYTWVNGLVPGASVLNPGVRDVTEFLLSPPHAKAHRATAGIALTAGTSSVVNLDGETYDSTNTMHSVASNLSRVLAPEDGLYSVIAQLGLPSQTASIVLDLRVNAAGAAGGGTSVATARVPHPNAGTCFGQIVTEVPLSAGDYVELFVTPAVTASLAAGSQNTYMAVRWVTKL